MADRSPNFPSMSLGEAIDAVRLIYQREGRSKMPRLSAVKPLGYSSINGRSLSVLGALRAYGLLEGRGDDVKVSDDAISILNAPHDSVDRKEALGRAFEAPASFALLRAKGDASPDTLRWHLIKANFRDDSADRLLKVYLASRDLVNAGGGAYHTPSGEADPDDFDALLNDPPSPRAGATHPSPTQQSESLAMGVQERVLQSGMLSKTASYRVIVSGPVGEAEIDRLLKKLEMDKEILADGDSEGERSYDEDRDPRG
jgi:hypothetical protein